MSSTLSPYNNTLSPRLSRQNSGDLRHSHSAPVLNHIQQNEHPIDLDDVKTKIHSPKCDHTHPCLQHVVFKGFFRSFATAYAIKTSVSLALSVVSGKVFKRKGIVRQIYLGNDALQFAQFVGVMSSTQKGIVCLLRNLTEDDETRHANLHIYHGIAGFVSGFAALLDDPSRLKSIALFGFVRAVGDAIRIGLANEVIPSIPNFDVYVFAVTQAPILYATLHCPEVMDRKFYEWILYMGGWNHEGMEYAMRTPHDEFIECEGYLHAEKSCTQHIAFDFFGGWRRAFWIYLPVHLLPTIIFHPKSIWEKSILQFSWKKLKAILRSALVFTTYQTIAKVFVCGHRNLLQRDSALVQAFLGIPAGLAVGLEVGYRRPELTLVSVVRCMDVVMRLLPRDSLLGRLIRLRWLSLLLFAVSMAIWHSIRSSPKWIKLSNGLNMTGLKVFFGSPTNCS